MAKGKRKKKRPLAGAAKAAHARRLAKARRKRKGRARRKGTNVAKSKKRRRRRRGGGNRGNRRLRVVGAGAVYGYLKSQTEVLQKVPVIPSIGKDATAAVLLHFAAKHFRNRWLDDAATAVAGHCGVEFGESGLKMEEFVELSGAGDDDEISGVLG